MDAFATQVTGWLFVAAAAMTWVGLTFLPVPIGSFFERDDFTRVLDGFGFGCTGFIFSVISSP